MSRAIQDLIRQALAGERAAVEDLVSRIAPVVKAQVARTLYRHWRGSPKRSVAQECEDLTQNVFLVLFANGGRELRRWDPDRGLSFEGFVRLVADRHVGAILRSGRRSPWTEDPMENAEIDMLASRPPEIELSVITSDLANKLADRLQERLSPLGFHMFLKLYVEQRTVESVSQESRMSMEAVYAWRSRLKKIVMEIASEMMSENDFSS